MPVTLSIIINNYNYDQFLGQAIESAIALEWSPKEVIVVDDGSTDNSKDVILSFKDKIKYVFKENGGQASAFNTGFELATGDYIWFLDADDIIINLNQNFVLHLFETDFDAFHFKTINVSQTVKVEDRNLADRLMRQSSYEILPVSCLNEGYPPTSANIFSRRILEEIMPLDSVHWQISADTALILSARQKGRCCHVSLPIAFYRLHELNNFFYRAFDRSLSRKLKVGKTMVEKGKLLNQLMGYGPNAPADMSLKCGEVYLLILYFKLTNRPLNDIWNLSFRLFKNLKLSRLSDIILGLKTFSIILIPSTILKIIFR